MKDIIKILIFVFIFVPTMFIIRQWYDHYDIYIQNQKMNNITKCIYMMKYIQTSKNILIDNKQDNINFSWLKTLKIIQENQIYDQVYDQVYNLCFNNLN